MEPDIPNSFSPKKIANLLLNDFKGLLKKHKVEINTCGISPEEFVMLAKLLHIGVIDKKQFREIAENQIVNHKIEEENTQA